jgi:phosphomevalonate kinase
MRELEEETLKMQAMMVSEQERMKEELEHTKRLAKAKAEAERRVREKAQRRLDREQEKLRMRMEMEAAAGIPLALVAVVNGGGRGESCFRVRDQEAQAVHADGGLRWLPK